MAELTDQRQISDGTVRHMPRRRRQQMSPVKMRLNFTAMIDVIFQLLIYFVVTASFAIDEGILTAKLPEGTGRTEKKLKIPHRPIKIRLAALALPYECRIELVGLGRSPQNFKELAELLAAYQFNDQNTGGVFEPDNPVIIEPDHNVSWQHVVNAFNAAIKTRYTNVAFAQVRDK